MNPFDATLPPLAGIDVYRVVNAENTHIAYFRRIRDAVKAANSYRSIGAMVLDETNTIVYAIGQ